MSGFTSGMKSSATPEWSTPRDLFDELDAEFHFDLDVASTDENALCEKHYTKDDDGLANEWTGSVWCNPPYGREIGKWMRKAAESNWGGLLFALFQLAQIRPGGMSGLSDTLRKYGSFAGGSSSAVRIAALRSLPQSSCTTSGPADIGR